jgi:thiol-disulfide isomerase/thioredoxin
MGWLTRVGTALTAPARAVDVALAPGGGPRAGNDLLALLGLLVLASGLRRLIAAAWLMLDVGFGVGASVLVAALADALTGPLAITALAAAVLLVGLGRPWSLTRAVDGATVLAVPAVAVSLLATLALVGSGGGWPAWAHDAWTWASWAAAALATGLAVVARRRAQAVAADRPGQPRLARAVGAAVLMVALATIALQVRWAVANRDQLRPMRRGDLLPAVMLPEVTAAGTLGAPRPLAATGRVTVVEFWATWCGPCKQSLPGLARLAAELAGQGLDVVTVNLDDAAGARRHLSQEGLALALLRDDGVVSRQFGVSTIPHLLIVDRAGAVTAVHRGGTPLATIRAEVLTALASPGP